jgi:N6-L-threonylcarbamoyladenine synthase
MKILGIESSCDETAAAVVEDGHRLLSNVIHSQVDIHAVYGGVVPEVAARSHIEVINPVIQKALTDAAVTWDDIDAIAVTYAPGLIGSLLVGTLAARTLALTKNKPLYPIHHVEAHVYANFIDEQADHLTLTLPAHQPHFPLLALIVSGGHSQLVLFQDHGDYQLLGQTQDDAVGEAFDKVAKILGLPYPGGPSIAEEALRGSPTAYQLPKAKMKGVYDFSFSGLKTAVLRAVQREVGVDTTFPSGELAALLDDAQRADFAASFQRTAVETLVDKTEQAFHDHSPASVVIAGGVAANAELRKLLSDRLPLPIEYAPMALCTDNAAMIASLGYYQAQQLSPTPLEDVQVTPSLSMTKTAWHLKKS